MRILIYSDIHANWEALRALEAHLAALDPEVGCDASVCLGDVVGYGASPNEACAWVRAHSDVVIRGNHDRVAVTLAELEWFAPAAAAAARWTHETLNPESRAWLSALPAGPLVWNKFGLAHGSPFDEDEYLITTAQAARVFSATAALVTARWQWFGHTHVQGGFISRGGETEEFRAAPPGEREQAGVWRLELQPDARYLLNPGSVGQPRDGDGRTAFAILDIKAAVVEFHRIPYDVAGAQARILAAGLPPRLAERLSSGK